MTDQYDLILNDMVGTGKVCDRLAEKGKLVIGGGTFNDKLELDREYGNKVATSLTEAKSPHTISISKSNELMNLLESSDKPHVIKPLGNKKPGLTLVSKDKTNRMLKSVVKNWANELTPCIVQETLDGIEISTEGWFNGKSWVKPFNHTIEHKRLMEGDKGVQTGCMGNVVWSTEGDKLTTAVLEPLAQLLEKVDYVGPLDINCIVNEKEAFFLEFTARPGYDAIQAWAELIKAPLFDYLYGIASQQKENFDTHEGCAIAVRMSVFPFPGEEDVDEWIGIKVIDPPKEAMRHIWLADVMEKDGELLLAGVDGVVGCVTSRGSTVRECQRRAYRTINNITLTDDIQYRSDIGHSVEKDKEKLVEWGWLNA
jgi:phosphoribosylamine--glycine ligase